MRKTYVMCVCVSVLITCGCSSTHPSKTAAASTTTTISAPSRTTAAATIPSVSTTNPPPPVPSTTTATLPSATAGSELADAVRVVERHGFTPNSTDDYTYPEFRYGLHVIIASVTGSATGYSRRAFFFVHRRYIGTDLADTSAIIRLDWRDDATIALSYEIYKPDDAMCCPLGGAVTVRYHWTGTHLVALDPIPSLTARR